MRFAMRLATLAGSLVVLMGGAALAAQGDPLAVTGDGVNVRAGPRPNAKILVQVYHNEAAVEVAREGDWVQVRLPGRDITGWIHGSLVAPAGSAAPLAAAPPEPAPQPPAPAVVTAIPEPAAGPPPVAPTQPPVPAATALPAAQAQPKEPTAGAGGLAPADKPGGSQLAAVDHANGVDALTRFRDSVTYLNNRAVAVAGVDLFTEVHTVGNGVVQVTATDAWNNVPQAGQDSFMRTLYDRWLAAAGGTQPIQVQIVDQTGHVLKEKSGP